ncbi:MAG: acyltransferase [Muribaculaceae bacterium]|nr:acyltransferase [Muribaculaceae bacterium]
MNIPEEFLDICPVQDRYFRENMESLVREPGFEHAVKYVMPDIDYDLFIKQLLATNSKYEFQHTVMRKFLEMLEDKTTDGVSFSGIEKLQHTANTFITNHRDIVLDASFMNLCLFRGGFDSTEVAIGNNLLILDWIETLVKINKSFIVKRNLPVRQALEAARQLSGYLHFTIKEKNASLWIAQREGRAKDSNDFTQESLLKMMALEGEGTIVERLCQLNLSPVAISYEYDPNDYLKAKEYLLKRKNPDYKKSAHDDLLGMETGILKYKGRVHFAFGGSVNDQLSRIEIPDDKNETYKVVCKIIDNTIHVNYRIFPVNYIAYDTLYNVDTFADKYSADEKVSFFNYIETQLKKVDVATDESDMLYMKDMMLAMYSNPLRNQLIAKKELI